jgi:hypothetical protein
MKDFLVRLLLAAAMTLAAFALASPANAQQADEDPSPATPHPIRPAAAQQSQQHDARVPPSGDAQTQDSLTFAGRLMRERERRGRSC